MKFLPIPFFALAFTSCYTKPGPVVPETRVEKQMIGLLEKFDRYDLDGNGQLDSKELLAGKASTGHEPAEVIAFYDRDKNGTISLREAQHGFSRVDEAEAVAKKKKR